MSRLRVICRAAAAQAIHSRRVGALVAIAAALLAVGSLAHVPARLITACARWVALAALLELLSMLGFVLVFTLVFGLRSGTRERLRVGFRALGAIAVLPAGGLLGPAVAARGAGDETAVAPGLTRSTIALTILTNAPGLVVVGGVGFALWLGWLPGPHGALLTLPEAGVAIAILAGLWLIGRSPRPEQDPGREQPRSSRGRHLLAAAARCRDGVAEARRLVADGSWRLTGAIGYYAFDNAVLWAAFHAYGRAPAISVIVMGYIVGSLGAALPLPAGIGGVEGGLIGALVLYGAPIGPAAGAVLLYRGLSLSLQAGLGALAWGLVPARRLRPGGRRPRLTRSLRSGAPDAAR